MSYFFNISNTPSFQWSPEQIAAAEKFGKIIDIPFPELSSKAGSKEIERFADNFVLYRVFPMLGYIFDPMMEILGESEIPDDLNAVAFIEGEENLAGAITEALKIYSDGRIRFVKKDELNDRGQLEEFKFKITDQDSLYRYYKEHCLNAFLLAIQVAEAYADAFERGEYQADSHAEALRMFAESLKGYIADASMRPRRVRLG